MRRTVVIDGVLSRNCVCWIQALAGLQLGKPQTFKNLTLFPLIGTMETQPAYLTLDEALQREVARVTEVSEAGAVPELHFDNRAPSRCCSSTAKNSSAQSRTGY